MGNNEWEESKTITTKDGSIMKIWNKNLHCWEGPALIPEGNNKKREYYLYGIQYLNTLKI